MDSLTHTAIGACIGEITLGRKLGKHALWIGALAQNLPDIDIVAALWLPFSKNLLVHRGITHSFLFGAVAAILLTVLLAKWKSTRVVGILPLLFFFIGQIFLHDVLDTCNAYGTGLFLPFSEERFSWHLLYVADPLFSIWPVVSAIALVRLQQKVNVKRSRFALVGLLFPILYVGYAYTNKAKVDKGITASLERNAINAKSYLSTPTAFNNWLWYIVAATDSGYYIGYRSVFEEQGSLTKFDYYPQQNQLLHTYHNQTEIEDLRQFASGYYTVERHKDTLHVNVLRFGQVMGWQKSHSAFAFRYYLQPSIDNRLAVQRGRFEGWDMYTVQELFSRIFYFSEEKLR